MTTETPKAALAARDKFNYWSARNHAVAANLDAALERLELKLGRAAKTLTDIAKRLDVRGNVDIADEIRREARRLIRID